MRRNMGSTDRIVRFILAIVFGALYFTGTVTGTWGVVLLVIGVVFLLTSLVGFCPLYTLINANTRHTHTM